MFDAFGREKDKESNLGGSCKFVFPYNKVGVVGPTEEKIKKLVYS